MRVATNTKRNLVTAALIAPAAVWLTVFLVLPFIAMLVFAFGERAPEGGYQPAFTFAQFANLPTRAAAFWNTLMLAPAGALLCLVVAYPVAYYLAVKANPRYRLILVSLVVVPFWTSLLVRTYAWMYILGSRGIPNLLSMIGIEDVRMLNTPGAVLLGIVYGYLPLMIMPIYVSLEKLDRRLLEASADLGGKPVSTFLGVTLPLSLPGVMTGRRARHHPASRRVSDPAAARRRQGLLHRQCAGRSLPAVAELALRIGDRGDPRRRRRRRPHGGDADRLEGRRNKTGGSRLMRAFISSVYLFLYAPIALVVLFSFNAGRNASEFTGFSLAWYGKALGNTFLVSALQNSLIIAFTSATLAAVFGTMAALGMERLGSRMRALFDALFAAAIVVPGVVIGIATLVALVAVFSFVNPTIAALWPGEQPPQLGLGYGSIIAAHGLFSMALVTMIVKARIASLGRDIVEASGDLYATPLTTFRLIVLPQILPSILAGFLLAFTFSFDDFIIAFFVAGSKTTLPIYVFASIRRGVTPEINAIATLVLVASLLLILTARVLMREKKSKSGE